MAKEKKIVLPINCIQSITFSKGMVFSGFEVDAKILAKKLSKIPDGQKYAQINIPFDVNEI